MDHPRGLIEFMELYATEEACAKAIFEHRWPERLRLQPLRQ